MGTKLELTTASVINRQMLATMVVIETKALLLRIFHEFLPSEKLKGKLEFRKLATKVANWKCSFNPATPLS